MFARQLELVRGDVIRAYVTGLFRHARERARGAACRIAHVFCFQKEYATASGRVHLASLAAPNRATNAALPCRSVFVFSWKSAGSYGWAPIIDSFFEQGFSQRAKVPSSWYPGFVFSTDNAPPPLPAPPVEHSPVLPSSCRRPSILRFPGGPGGGERGGREGRREGREGGRGES